jgi:hypothetical protein
VEAPNLYGASQKKGRSRKNGEVGILAVNFFGFGCRCSRLLKTIRRYLNRAQSFEAGENGFIIIQSAGT